MITVFGSQQYPVYEILSDCPTGLAGVTESVRWRRYRTKEARAMFLGVRLLHLYGGGSTLLVCREELGADPIS